MGKMVFINGKMLTEEQAVVSIGDRGLTYGDGVFETVRAYSGRFFRLDQHLARLEDGLKTLLFDHIPQRDVLQSAVRQTLTANGWGHARIKLIVTRGVSDTPSPTNVPSTVIVTGKPITDVAVSYWSAAFVSVRRDETSPLSRIKSLNYLPSILGLIEAHSKGADEGLLLNGRGNLAEGSVSNIFIVTGREITTPSIEDGALPGITRAAVIETAQHLGITVHQRSIRPEEMQIADEVLATNSVIGVRPITHIDSLPVGSGLPGAITQELARGYRSLVQCEL